ncbi:hypothetical protein KY289_035639 [Solanum tuberosum]|nr:hypothetical protein KY289_035639 [Solanum tuberosum]
MALSIFFFAQEKSHPPKSPLRNEQKRVYKGEIKVYHFGKKRGENRIGAGQNRNSHFDSSVQNFPRTKKKAGLCDISIKSHEIRMGQQREIAGLLLPKALYKSSTGQRKKTLGCTGHAPLVP